MLYGFAPKGEDFGRRQKLSETEKSAAFGFHLKDQRVKVPIYGQDELCDLSRMSEHTWARRGSGL